jgi:tripartite-type tricarboxylate transporter receptor subunit TctC
VGTSGEPIAVIGGIFAPKGVPREVAQRIEKAVDEVLRNPEVVSRFAAMETGLLRVSNDAFLAQLRKEAPGWQTLVKQLELKAD